MFFFSTGCCILHFFFFQKLLFIYDSVFSNGCVSRLNYRGVGEGKNGDCSLQLQSQPGGPTATSSRFVDDPSANHIFFSDFPGGC